MDRAVELHAFLAETRARHLPYRLGAHDGAMFAADWILRLTGTDVASGFRQSYRSRAEAQAQLEELGFTGPGEFLSDCLAELNGWSQARLGDVALLDGEGGLCFGIVGGRLVHVLHPVIGLDVVRLDAARKVWRP